MGSLWEWMRGSAAFPKRLNLLASAEYHFSGERLEKTKTKGK